MKDRILVAIRQLINISSRFQFATLPFSTYNKKRPDFALSFKIQAVLLLLGSFIMQFYDWIIFDFPYNSKQ